MLREGLSSNSLEQSPSRSSPSNLSGRELADYAAHAAGYGYVTPHVLVEFGTRSTGEPAEMHEVACDAAEYLSALSFPVASPRVMRAEGTFWEKAVAVHIFCVQGRIKDRLARHWYDS
jgi:hypothetical protein